MTTHYAEKQFADALSQFLGENSGYAAASVDQLREREYGRLDRLGHVYLDYTGGGLYAESQVREHLALLSDSVLGNPHSKNPTSLASTHLVDEARASVLEFFSADSAEYDVIFTSNASGALKLVGESYPFGEGDRYLLTYDNHNSVNGIREYARSRGASVTYLPVGEPDLRLDCKMVTTELERVAPAQEQPVRVSRTEQLQWRAAPARMGRAGPGAGLGRDPWTALRSRRPTGWTSRRSSRTSCRCPSTRCSATPPVRVR